MFIKPPSMAALEKRLRDRKTETEESLQRRLGAAQREMEYGSEENGNFDIVVTNDDVDRAYADLRAFVLPEINRGKR